MVNRRSTNHMSSPLLFSTIVFCSILAFKSPGAISFSKFAQVGGVRLISHNRNILAQTISRDRQLKIWAIDINLKIFKSTQEDPLIIISIFYENSNAVWSSTCYEFRNHNNNSVPRIQKIARFLAYRVSTVYFQIRNNYKGRTIDRNYYFPGDLL